MVHFPGLRSDFARWEKAGARDWGFDNVRPVIERMTCDRPEDLVPPRRCPKLDFKQTLKGKLRFERDP
jgi:hypothetical protein